MRDHWNLWRYCSKCNHKFFSTEQDLNYGGMDSGIKKTNELAKQFFLDCPACQTSNIIEAICVPSDVQNRVRKAFYQRKKTERHEKGYV